MSVSGYQVEGLLKDFRKRFGSQTIPEHRIDSLDISQEAQYEADRLKNYFQRPNAPTPWVTPQNILDLIADRTEYQALVEYEQQRRAGLFLEPVYFPPNPPPAIALVQDHFEHIAQVKATATVDTAETQPKQLQPPPVQEIETVQHVDIEAERDDFLLEEESDSSEEEDRSVVFGTGRINLDAMAEFIQVNPDSALKFMAQRELNDKHLPANILDIHDQWRQRGLSRRAIRDYILELMGWEALPNSPLYDIWSEVRDRIYELRNEGAP